MSKSLALAIVGLSAIVSTAAHAGPPPQLLGKSVVVNWSETRSQRSGDNPDYRTVDASHTLIVYVSSAGRVFIRQVNRTKSGSGKMDQGPGESGSATTSRTASFDAQSMTVIGESIGGARRTTAKFDNSFTTCTAIQGTGFQEGKTHVSISSITKKRVEIRSVVVSGVSCSIQSGNAFGST